MAVEHGWNSTISKWAMCEYKRRSWWVLYTRNKVVFCTISIKSTQHSRSSKMAGIPHSIVSREENVSREGDVTRAEKRSILPAKQRLDQGAFPPPLSDQTQATTESNL